MDIITQTDPRIQEIVALAQEDGRPLALAAETICALEDAGYLADPFTGMIWRDPAAPLAMTAPPALLRAMQDLIEETEWHACLDALIAAGLLLVRWESPTRATITFTEAQP